MFHALDMGVSAESFWAMSPRAIVLLHKEMRRGAKAQSGRPRPDSDGPVRLDYIPRP